jgi:hypothetical protein
MDKNQAGMDRMLQDLWLRQRNIVFPDTVRNDGNFYRNLARRDQSRDALQRVGTMMLAAILLMTGCVFVAMAIGLVVEGGFFALIPAVIFLAGALVWFALGAKLAFAAVLPATIQKPNQRLLRRRRISGLK